MCHQKFHLVSEDTATRQIDVLSMGRHKGHGPQLHPGLFRCAIAFMMITPLASGHHIPPDIPPALAERFYVIS
tara:strand:+ start:1524 stop:1742 length:219 start_codon:yes stop_codon:yes gene_type:complete